ncbi:peptidoglycan bridge formation glycyltransferase FemA/FemB family protein [Candidatus Saccharibacteria bacterium]|nr:peptidoglycan bridge formation glycyltransferase FemA/FemB family protein [Candidatus Saccharibacteria bacterium]
MKFTTLEESEFVKFAKKNPYRSFTQTPEIAKLREKDGWTVYYFGVKENDELKTASMIVAKPTFLGKSIFIAPGGPLLDLEDTKLTNFFFKNLRNYIKSHNGYVLHIDPYYELTQRDRDGKIVENGFNHQKAKNNLLNLGFKEIKNPSQPKYLFVMDLDKKTPDEIFKNFKQNTRNLVRKAERKGVKVRKLNRDELSEFKEITEITSQRRNFNDRPLSYYENMYDLFHEKGEVEFLLAETEIDGKTTPLSSAMFMLYGDEIIYLFSGSDKKYMRDYDAQYLIQWHMIKYASENRFKRYNFYGIRGLPDKNSKDYGIYGFKKGFGGHVVELIGSYELPINRPFFYLHKFLSKIKNH